MADDLTIARAELIIGGQRSGKSRRAESLAAAWLAQSGAHRAVMIATGQAWDDEMRERIARHRMDRAVRVPKITTVEEPLALPEVIAGQCAPDTLIVVDCLTLWLTNWLMPADGAPRGEVPLAALNESIAKATGPIVLVSNEIGLGVIPMGRDVRAFVDAQGRLNQQVAQVCTRVTLMAAGLPLLLKDAS
ncbi:MAG: bifunctional adenosylcobinamide kinase/adenosylcobinamide-phosphate guanylyltransferase [Comamonadaceae bacterium]|nr:MAG: bifunctional adenosylcobinamide kinase/adenosylcobinamide-phosphate guanylyltransferase [Comamonadaceae bacterium]